MVAKMPGEKGWGGGVPPGTGVTKPNPGGSPTTSWTAGTENVLLPSSGPCSFSMPHCPKSNPNFLDIT